MESDKIREYLARFSCAHVKLHSKCVVMLNHLVFHFIRSKNHIVVSHIVNISHINRVDVPGLRVDNFKFWPNSFQKLVMKRTDFDFTKSL